jgi:serine protease Do
MERMARATILALICINVGLIGIVLVLLASQPQHDESQSSRPGLVFAATAQAASPIKDPSRENIIVEAARKVSPAVVSIGILEKGYVREFNPFFDDFFSPFVLHPYTRKLPFLGSGVIINSNGYILTNYHVVEGAHEILVTLVDGRELKGRILDADDILDIALIKVDGSDFPSAKMGDSDRLIIGEWVMAIGNPFGKVLEDPNPTVTVGVVSALRRSFKPSPRSSHIYQDMIQTDAAINPGNSGGPLVNVLAEVVGINTFIVSRTGASHGIGFAIPINKARAVVKEIVTYGKIRPLWLDFECINLTPYLVKTLEAPSTEGALIYSMRKGGPAEKADLRVGDIIIQANEKKIRSRDDLITYIVTMHVGEKITLGYIREGKTHKTTYILEEFK